MIFLTLGSYPLPFDRIINWIDILIEESEFEEEIFAQIGYSNYIPINMKWIKMLPKDEFDVIFSQASGIISHAGMGNINMALKYQKPLVVVPRMVKYNEHVSDHQVATAKKFEQLNHVLAAYSIADLKDRLFQFKDFIPSKRITTPQDVSNRIKIFLNSI